MARDRNGIQPASPDLDGRPDRRSARVADKKVNELLCSGKANRVVPLQYDRELCRPNSSGRGRRVYPGFLQLCAFMRSMERRAALEVILSTSSTIGSSPATSRRRMLIRDFYKEYFAIMDMSADFYLETVDQVFQRLFKCRAARENAAQGRADRPLARSRKHSFWTVEGEKDDICAVGPRLAAQDLCSGSTALHEDPSFAGGRRPLRRVQLAKRWEAQSPLSGAAQRHPVEPVGPCCTPAHTPARLGGSKPRSLMSGAHSEHELRSQEQRGQSA